MSGIKAQAGVAMMLGVTTVMTIAGVSDLVRADSPDQFAGTGDAPTETRYELAEICRIDQVPPSGTKGGFSFKRRSKPPDYLLPKKEDAATERDGGAGAWQNPDEATVGTQYVESLTELKGLYDKGLIEAQEYEATQIRILTDLDPADSGVEGGLLLLRQLWDQGLISEAPYAQKRQEMLDAL